MFEEGDRAMWRAVLLQRVLDYKSSPGNQQQTSERYWKKVEQHRSAAIKFFRLSNKDFVDICALAEYDPEYVLEKVRRLKCPK